ncbi:MAG: PAS domain S-box protein [Caldilineaceae bacterium]
MLTTKKVMLPRRSDLFHPRLTKHIFPLLGAIDWVKLLDLLLLITLVLLLFTSEKIFYFHLVFVFLTFGAFYWQLRAFTLRSSVYVTATMLALLVFVLKHEVDHGELIEIPMLTTILLLVFGIARQRAKAEWALRKANEALEQRVVDRTADLLSEIHERQQTEQTLRESEERYRRLVELSFETILIHLDDKLIYVNPSGVKLLGAASGQALIGQSLLHFVHPDSIDAVQARLKQVKLETKGVPLAEGRLVQPDGVTVDIEMVTIPITYQGQTAMQTVVRDIRARKQAEQARTAERMAIARDLHDSMGQSVGYLHLKLDEITTCAPLQTMDNLYKDLLRMRDVADEAYGQIRSMLAALMPANTQPFAKALCNQVRTIAQQTQLAIQFINRGPESPLPPVAQQQLLWLCREAVTNITKHAHAQTAKIELWWTDENLTITIADDGQGFDLNLPSLPNSFGLRIMQERAEQLAGVLLIQSSPRAGTLLTLQIPLPVGDE